MKNKSILGCSAAGELVFFAGGNPGTGASN
jgi:hypothetical protein